jgi:hypothetical protein
MWKRQQSKSDARIAQQVVREAPPGLVDAGMAAGRPRCCIRQRRCRNRAMSIAGVSSARSPRMGKAHPIVDLPRRDRNRSHAEVDAAIAEQQLSEWIAWARQKIDTLDPSQKGVARLFEKISASIPPANPVWMDAPWNAVSSRSTKRNSTVRSPSGHHSVEDRAGLHLLTLQNGHFLGKRERLLHQREILVRILESRRLRDAQKPPYL